jgi:vacuolar protein sorting-associated protein 35
MSAMATPPGEEGKLLSEALNTVKIQVQQMKRYLVRIHFAAQT